jgi:hypothetical protein
MIREEKRGVVNLERIALKVRAGTFQTAPLPKSAIGLQPQ